MSEIDLKLSVLCVVINKGAHLTQTQIAACCDCSRQYIDKIEQSALNKLRISAETHGIEDWRITS